MFYNLGSLFYNIFKLIYHHAELRNSKRLYLFLFGFVCICLCCFCTFGSYGEVGLYGYICM